MSSVSTLKPKLYAAREALANGREKLRHQHDEGSPGIQVCAKLTDLADDVVGELLSTALDDLDKIDKGNYRTLHKDVALVAHGGYGRRELAPYSDLDLMIMHTPAVTDRVAVLAERLMRDIFDVGFVLGHSVRTPKQAVSLACKDPLILTSLTESRCVAGNAEMTDRFVQHLRRTARRRAKTLLPAIELARRAERQQYGETVYMLEPNIKRSRGGLRDVQLIRWFGFCCYGVTDLDGLYLADVLSKDEQQMIREATEFLLRTRNEVHFHSGKAYDQLDRSEQVRLAERFGYKGSGEGILPVEEFMRDYFRHTQAVRYISTRFRANARRRSPFSSLYGMLVSHQVERDFRVGHQIDATRRGLRKIGDGDLREILRLAELANLYDKRIAHETWEAVRRTAAASSGHIAPETAARFLSLLSTPSQLPRLLKRLHEMGVLEKLIPALTRARGLLQFNQYHKYTVDEHCIRAVQAATQFASDDGPLSRVYSSIKDKRILHLALLIHDLGKGYVEDHSEVGRRIAIDTAAHLYLPKHQQEMLEFLVHQHLLMTHLALWRDISDPAVAVQLAVKVGSPELLQMLYILSAADLASVGPGVLNDWKVDLLTRLFEQTLQHLSGDAPATSEDTWLEKRRAAIRESLGEHCEDEWFERQLAALPPQYLQGTTPEKIADALKRIKGLSPNKAIAWGDFQDDQGVIELTIGAFENMTRGIFHKLTGALSGQRVEILSAQINTLSDGLILDRFHVVDMDSAGLAQDERIEKICESLVNAIQNGKAGPPKFKQIWKPTSKAAPPPAPPRAVYDNATSEACTIVQIFAQDRMGLLYTITRKLHKMGLSVVTAKIGTHLDQVVDVFYVTDEEGRKIHDEPHLDHICDELLAELQAFEKESAAQES